MGTAPSTYTPVVVDIAVLASKEVQSFNNTAQTVSVAPNATFCAGIALDAPLQINLHLSNNATLSTSVAFAPYTNLLAVFVH